MTQVARNGAANVLLAEDHPAVREGLELLLQRAGHHVIGWAADVAQGVRLYDRRRPDVLIADYSLGDEFGTELIQRVAAIDPDVRVIVYTGHTDAKTHATILAAGARGLVLKGSDVELLLTAVDTVIGGGTYIDATAYPHAPRRLLTRRFG